MVSVRKLLAHGALAAFVFLGVTANYSRAAIIAVAQPGNPVAQGGGIFRYTYDASLAPDQQIQTGDYFAIIDFAGYVPGSVFSTNANFAATAQLTTTPPQFQAFPDDPTIQNLLFTYTGATPTTGPVLDLGDFGANSTSTIAGSIVMTAEAHKEAVQGSGNYTLRAGNSTFVQGPVAAVPEPATMTMLGFGALSLVGFGIRRRRQALAIA